MKLRILLLAGLSVSAAAQVAPAPQTPPSTAESNVRASYIKAWNQTYGTFDQAAVMSVTAGSATEPRTEVLGFKDPSELSTYSNRDSVALYAANIPSAPLVPTPNTTFTANSVTSGAFAAIRSNLH